MKDTKDYIVVAITILIGFAASIYAIGVTKRFDAFNKCIEHHTPQECKHALTD